MTSVRLADLLERMAADKYTGCDLNILSDKITWLWKWRKISRAEMEYLTDLVIYICGDLEEMPVKSNYNIKENQL